MSNNTIKFCSWKRYRATETKWNNSFSTASNQELNYLNNSKQSRKTKKPCELKTNSTPKTSRKNLNTYNRNEMSSRATVWTRT